MRPLCCRNISLEVTPATVLRATFVSVSTRGATAGLVAFFGLPYHAALTFPPDDVVFNLTTTIYCDSLVPGLPALLLPLDTLYIDKANEFPVGTPIGMASDWIAKWTSLDTLVAQTILLAQNAPASGAKPLGPQNIWEAFFASPLPLIAGLAMIWYVTWFLPEKRKRQNEATLLSSLTKNDRVVTIGGLHGTVVSALADSDVITLKIDEAGTTRVKVNRSAISAITEHAKGKPLGKDGKPGTEQPSAKAARSESLSKNASAAESSE